MPPKLLLKAILCLLLIAGCRETTTVQTSAVDDSIIRLSEAGTIIAANTIIVSGPSSWGSSQRITWLIDEGAQVAEGDTLILFETSEFDDYIQQNVDELDVMRLAVTSTRAQGVANRTRVNNNIDKAQLASEMADLDKENQRYEARSVRENSVLAGRQAEIDLQQAYRDSQAQATLDSLEIAQATLKAVKQEARVRRLQTYLDMLTVTAHAAGMVVYHREYTEEGVKVYRSGDEVRRRAPVLEITDTSAMKVRFTVHEKDRWRLHSGQDVTIILDAYTDTTFVGVVEKVGRLPMAAADGDVARRFEATANIHDKDPRLKAGMSARVIVDLGGSL